MNIRRTISALKKRIRTVKLVRYWWIEKHCNLRESFDLARRTL